MSPRYAIKILCNGVKARVNSKYMTECIHQNVTLKCVHVCHVLEEND